MPKPGLTQQERVARSMSEKELQDAIIELAEHLGWKVWHVRDSRTQMVEDMPDLVLRRPAHMEETTPGVVKVSMGQLEWWELKTELRKVTPGQEIAMQELRDCYQVVRVVRPSDWLNGNVEKWLR